MSIRTLIVLFALSLGACGRDPEASLRSVQAQQRPGEVLLDLREDGARLLAVVQPVLPFSDAPRSVVARWLDRAEASGSWTFDGIAVFDARFVPGSQAVLVVTAQRELVLVPSRQGMPVHLDAQVHAPLSLSHDGRYAAYARGEIPDLEIVRFDLGRREQVAATREMAPAWCPALSADGSRLLFMSGATGFPELWEMLSDGSVARRTDRRLDPVPFPSGPTAPVWFQGVLAFENRDGVHLMSVDPPRHLRSVPGALPVAAGRSGAVIVQDGSEARWISLRSAEVGR